MLFPKGKAVLKDISTKTFLLVRLDLIMMQAIKITDIKI